MGFELRASRLLGKHSTALVMPLSCTILYEKTCYTFCSPFFQVSLLALTSPFWVAKLAGTGLSATSWLLSCCSTPGEQSIWTMSRILQDRLGRKGISKICLPESETLASLLVWFSHFTSTSLRGYSWCIKLAKFSAQVFCAMADRLKRIRTLIFQS
jgi:hypothetical protein